MKRYRTETCGRVVEVLVGEWGSEQVRVDGRLVSTRPFAGLLRGSHFFDLDGGDGARHRVEVRRVDLSKIGLGRYRMVVTVDGVDRCRLEPLDPSRPLDACVHCGYSLRGLLVEREEIQCPECGRHTAAALLGRRAADEQGRG